MGVDEFIGRRDALLEKGKDYLKDRSIGQHVLALLERDGQISAESLLKELEITAVEGSGNDRLLARAAADCVRSLLR